MAKYVNGSQRGGGGRNLLDRHGAPHQGKMPGKRTYVLIGTRFLGSGKFDGFGLCRTKELGGGNHVAHQGLRKRIGGVGARSKSFLAECDGGDALFEHNQIMTHGNLGDLTNVLERELNLGTRFNLEAFYVELHGVVPGDDDFLRGLVLGTGFVPLGCFVIGEGAGHTERYK